MNWLDEKIAKAQRGRDAISGTGGSASGPQGDEVCMSLEQATSLRAQLLVAREEALEWAYDNTGLDMSFSSRHRDKAHFVKDGLAALRAKGAGK